MSAAGRGRFMFNYEDDICLIETEYEENDSENAPDPNKWQSYELSLLEDDVASGVCWHPATEQTDPVAKQPDAKTRLHAVQREVASWFVQADGKFLRTANKDTRLGQREIEKLIPQLLALHFPGDELVARNLEKLTFSAIFGASPDPRMSFGVYSGKAYPQPGNPSKRLFRDGVWDINTWKCPEYRKLSISEDAIDQTCPFEEMLRFAIPVAAQRTMLLDWITWNLRNEHSKPNWAVMLYSETKGTGKSTIGKVMTALFGAQNTASINGIRALTQRFSADTMDRKLVVAEEVHISGHSAEGNALKDLITNTVVSVERKYQPLVTIPNRTCFLFMTNHKPLWLEGGERRYYIIDMNHEGHAQGSQNDLFSALAGKVNELSENPQFIRDLYERLVVRELSASFDPKNLRFNENATPIMRELQANSGNENEHVLSAILEEYHAPLILSEDFAELAAYLRLKNATSLRNMLAKLGWEARRISFGGRQYRVWCEKTLQIENGRVSHPGLAQTFHPSASSTGYTWFDLAYFVDVTWRALRASRLLKGKMSSEIASTKMDWDNSNGNFGPFQSSTSHRRLQARTERELGEGADVVSFMRV